MSVELFPDSAMHSPSPHLIWLRNHNLAIGQLPEGQHFCVGVIGVGLGDTHHDAELEYCKCHNEDSVEGASDPIEHYLISEFNKAIKPLDVAEEIS